MLLGAGFRFGYPELAVLGAPPCVGRRLRALAYAAWRPRLTVTRARRPGPGGARRAGARVTLTVRNTSRLRRGEPASPHGPVRRPAGTVPVPLLRLRPGRDTDGPLPGADRTAAAWSPVGPLQVTRRDPLGPGRRWPARYGDTGQVWVHPRIHPMQAVPAGLVAQPRRPGRPGAARQHHLRPLREYVVGDELRHVHWRTSARVGELMVREHVDTSLPRLVVLLDDRAAAHPTGPDGVGESFEAACEAAASVVAAAVREDLPVSCSWSAARADGRRPDRGAARGLLDLLAEADLRAGDRPTLRSARPTGCASTGSATP